MQIMQQLPGKYQTNIARAVETLKQGGCTEVILYSSDEDHAFVAEAPELGGCMADGATYQEALTNVETVIQEWIEVAQSLSRTIPEPKRCLIYA